MQLHVNQTPSSNAAVLLAKFSNSTAQIVQSDSTSAEYPFVEDNGKKTTGFIAVATAILGGNHANLLGESNDEKKEMDKAVQLVTELQTLSKEGGNKLTGKLQKVNKDLLAVVFYIGNRLTVLDFVLYTTLHPIISTWKDAEITNMPNVARYFNFIQNQPNIKGQLPSLDQVAINLSLKARPQTAEEAALYETKEDKPKPQQQPKQPKQANENNNNQQKKAEDKKPEEKKGKEESKQKQGQGQGKKQETAEATDNAAVDVSRLDIRVGKIVEVKKHPDAESLYVEKIDLGEATGPRQIVSGLVKFVPIEQMQDRMVVVLCNLKPAKLRGVESQGMVLAASNEEHTSVELLTVPEGTKIGERVTFEGYGGNPDPVLNPKLKIFEAVAPGLSTDANRVATYKGTPFKTSTGVVTVASLTNAHIK
mmetsp:Transcript_15113/g.21091  ORF Transcript_15113/g.21091 Transcript_15113/m.21091 type:complete len:422 (+) Transcript_15113:99-1364(+)|eukprot:CAMPEP_0168570036 /NCGR_PEP_ID=MMETSP0413-20121227/16501_1 /TAXON_ID=136452 /ORGANISM="Filamoeba nolandi, Strain NC-AS-23-1" /LENGTH=421 /DNA_ID=CAMNT_0008602621 /DNA_START=71 /DNA_END=1336 /DNA_ORIENTATION=+